MTEFDMRPDALPPELVDLDRELSEIAIEERGSFEAELRAELAEEYRRIKAAVPRAHSTRGRRIAVAAAAALVVTGTLAVPPARASLVRLFWSPPVVEDPVALAVQEPVVAPPAPVDEPVETGRTHSKPSPAAPQVDLSGLPEWPAPLPTTFPVLLDREMARRIVADEYPDSLQEVGVGGTVQVLLWVRPDGAADFLQVGKSSGIADLDMAALRATRTFRFLPATRSGESVGTWVEFSIRFRPFAEDEQPDPEDHAFQIPLSN